MSAGGRVIGELIPQREGSLDYDVVHREKAFQGNRGISRLVKSVHQNIHADTWQKMRAFTDGEDVSDSVLRRRS